MTLSKNSCCTRFSCKGDNVNPLKNSGTAHKVIEMRWESRGENLNLLDNICHSLHTFLIINIINHGHLGCQSHPQLLGERLDVLGSLENAGIDWLVFR